MRAPDVSSETVLLQSDIAETATSPSFSFEKVVAIDHAVKKRSFPSPGFLNGAQFLQQLEQSPDHARSLVKGRQLLARIVADSNPLRAFRLRKGWSQKALAMKMGTPQPYYARIESNPSKAGYEFMRKLCEATGMDMNKAAALLHGWKKNARQDSR